MSDARADFEARTMEMLEAEGFLSAPDVPVEVVEQRVDDALAAIRSFRDEDGAPVFEARPEAVARMKAGDR